VSKLRESAYKQECTIMLPKVCKFDNDAVVLAHVRLFGLGGIGLKPSDIHGVYACSECHDWLDRRAHKTIKADRYEYILRALMRTHEKMARMQLLGFANTKRVSMMSSFDSYA
jgi:hypothetical protein